MTFRHPAIRYGVTVYLTSDKLDTTSAVTVSAPVPFPAVSAEPTPREIFASLNRTDLVAPLYGATDDWRLSTKPEVDAFLDGEE